MRRQATPRYGISLSHIRILLTTTTSIDQLSYVLITRCNFFLQLALQRWRNCEASCGWLNCACNAPLRNLFRNEELRYELQETSNSFLPLLPLWYKLRGCGMSSAVCLTMISPALYRTRALFSNISTFRLLILLNKQYALFRLFIP